MAIKNFNKPIKTLKGEPIKQADGAIATMCDMVTIALIATMPSTKPEDKNSRYKLAQRIVAAGGELDFIPEELVMIKNCVSESCTVLVTGQIFEEVDK